MWKQFYDYWRMVFSSSSFIFSQQYTTTKISKVKIRGGEVARDDLLYVKRWDVSRLVKIVVVFSVRIYIAFSWHSDLYVSLLQTNNVTSYPTVDCKQTVDDMKQMQFVSAASNDSLLFV